MEASVLKVVRDGALWGVAANGELLALARTRQAAHDLANSAADILRDSGAEVRVDAAEPRSFQARVRRKPDIKM